MSYRGSDESGIVFGCLFLFCIGAIVGFGAIWLFVNYTGSFIEEKQAIVRFQELTQTQNIQVVRHSNNKWFVGNPNNVTFELLVDGKPKQGNCFSGIFSEMICRMYDPRAGE